MSRLVTGGVCVYCCVSGRAAEAPIATPLMEITGQPVEQPVQQPSTHRDLQMQTPAADSKNVAFRLGGSEETDLDNSDVDTMDTDAANGENLLLILVSSQSIFIFKKSSESLEYFLSGKREKQKTKNKPV